MKVHHSFPTTSNYKKQPQSASTTRFKGLDGAIQQFAVNTLGVAVSKAVTARTWLDLFESQFLEVIENLVFCFGVPILAKHCFGPLFKKWCGSTLNAIGSPLKNKVSSKALLAAKSGTLLASLSVSAGLAYLITPVRNALTAQWFNTHNFEAIAGLSAQKNHVKAGEVDPITKAKRRLVQVAFSVASGLALAGLVARAIPRSQSVANAAQSILKYVDFSSGFDLSKPILSLLIITGVISYFDASRDRLERAENATRLSGVVPYMLFGKEVIANGLAAGIEHLSVKSGSSSKKIRDWIRLVDPKQPKASFLDFNQVKPKANIEKELKALQQAGKITKAAREEILAKYRWVGIGSYLISALMVGTGLNLVTIYFTKLRAGKQVQQKREGVIVKPLPRDWPVYTSVQSTQWPSAQS